MGLLDMFDDPAADVDLGSIEALHTVPIASNDFSYLFEDDICGDSRPRVAATRSEQVPGSAASKAHAWLEQKLAARRMEGNADDERTSMRSAAGSAASHGVGGAGASIASACPRPDRAGAAQRSTEGACSAADRAGDGRERRGHRQRNRDQSIGFFEGPREAGGVAMNTPSPPPSKTARASQLVRNFRSKLHAPDLVGFGRSGTGYAATEGNLNIITDELRRVPARSRGRTVADPPNSQSHSPLVSHMADPPSPTRRWAGTKSRPESKYHAGSAATVGDLGSMRARGRATPDSPTRRSYSSASEDSHSDPETEHGGSHQKAFAQCASTAASDDGRGSATVSQDETRRNRRAAYLSNITGRASPALRSLSATVGSAARQRQKTPGVPHEELAAPPATTCDIAIGAGHARAAVGAGSGPERRLRR